MAKYFLRPFQDTELDLLDLYFHVSYPEIHHLPSTGPASHELWLEIKVVSQDPLSISFSFACF